MTERIRCIKGFIFDLDGTLVDSTLDFRLLKSLVGCPDGTDILVHVASIEDESARVHATNIIQQHELADAHQSDWMPGAERLVSKLSELGLPMAIVTRNFAEAARIKIQRNAIPISLLLSREDAPPKPDPTALLMVAKQWQLAPGDIIYIGDYLYDVQAAKRASMLACLFAPDSVPHYASEADIICQDFEKLLPVLEMI